MKLITDIEIAEILGMSPSWVRVERHNRKHGKQHWLQVDAVYIGSRSPRYRLDEFNSFLESALT